MTTLALITMLTVQITVTAVTAWFLIRTLRKASDRKPPETNRTPKYTQP